MRKTERILIALVVIAICVWFLFPTIKWYGFVPAEDKALINATSLQVKEYSQEQARDVLDYLNQNSSSEVSKEYSFVLTLAKEQVKGKGSTDLRPCADVLTAFSASADEGQALMEAVEQYCRQRMMTMNHVIAAKHRLPPNLWQIGDILLKPFVLSVTIQDIAFHPNFLERFHLFFNENSENRELRCRIIWCYM